MRRRNAFARFEIVTLGAYLERAQQPLGLQVVGRMDDDPRTLAAAHWVHQRLNPY